MYDTVVVGGGVAGLTAAVFSARRGHSTLVLVSDIPGGHLATIDSVEDFPGFPDGIAGYELGPLIQDQAARAGAEFQMAEAQHLLPAGNGWLLVTSDGEVEARTVIVAAGSRSRELGVEGEPRLIGKGISHCASCDGPFLRGKAAVVVGGGDSALQEAITLAGFAAHVHVLYRSGVPAAQEAYCQRAREIPSLTLRANAVVEDVLGDDTVQAVRVRDTVTGEVSTLDTDGLFVYIGLEPNTAFVRDILRLDDSGHIPTDVWMRTELPGVFAAGDIRSDSASQAVSAAGDGATAAIAAYRYLRG
jgi:thioredoxin reductase (NADPH)